MTTFLPPESETMGEALTAATIHISLLCYLLATIGWIKGYRARNYRWLWTAGCTFLVLHALCAFHFYLNWSHSEAVRLTAEQTDAMLGFRFGTGIWFSYFLIVVWMIDCVLLWRHANGGPRWWKWFDNAVHAYAFFILFNGTVVFEDGAVRIAGFIGTLWLIRLGWSYRHRRIGKPATTELQG